MTLDYVAYCQTVFALRKSGEWKAWNKSWEGYAKERWGLSKTRIKLICAFVKFRNLCLAMQYATLPDSPEQVKELLALPQKQWIETWDLVLDDNPLPIRPQNVESTMLRFHIYARKKLSPEARKAIRVRRAAKTMAEMESGTQLVGEIGANALGKNWNKAVEVVIDADQARLNDRSR